MSDTLSCRHTGSTSNRKKKEDALRIKSIEAKIRVIRAVEPISKPILAMQDIEHGFGRHKYYENVDVLANYKSRFEWRAARPTMERTIANKGIVLYER